MLKKTQLLPVLMLVLIFDCAHADERNRESPKKSTLFAYQEVEKQDLSLFPQWLSVLERQSSGISADSDCRPVGNNHCYLQQWKQFLGSIKNLPAGEQIVKVNSFVNGNKYSQDINIYGKGDYWATPVEFLENTGDCEDYAIMKMMSLKLLGHDMDTMRIVVVQDTRRRQPHAVMAIESNDDYLILDNQFEEVVSHNAIFHYVPVYSVNEKHWWMHLPN